MRQSPAARERLLFSFRSKVIHQDVNARKAETADITTPFQGNDYGRCVEEKTESSLEPKTTASSDDPIKRLYEELATLNTQQSGQPSDAGLSARIHERFSRLRQLQEQEAAAIERHFALHLALPIGDGQQLLEEARELIRRHESPPPSN